MSSDEGAPSSRRPTSEAPESVSYELEDHLGMFRETPTPSLTPDAMRGVGNEGLEFAIGPQRFGPDPGMRDTLTAESPRIDEIESAERSPEASNEESPPFASFLVRGARLSPVTEIDECRRSTGGTRISSQKPSTPRPSQEATLRGDCAMETEEISSPVQGVVESRSGLTEEGGAQMPSPRPTSSVSRRPSNTSSRKATKSRSRTPKNKRSFPNQPPLKDALLERLQSEGETWQADLRQYLELALGGVDPEEVGECSQHVEELLQNPCNAAAWLTFLSLDLHRKAELDVDEMLKQVLSTGALPPTFRTLYLWALKSSLSQLPEKSYGALLRAGQAVAPSGGSGNLLQLAFGVWELQGLPASDDTSPDRGPSLSRTVLSLDYIEGQLMKRFMSE